jgi:hypothetical protein
MTTKRKPSKKAKKKSRPRKAPRVAVADGARGKAIIGAMVAKLTGPNAISGDPRPLTDAEVLAAEQAADAALSPALFAAFTADAGHFARDYGWFDRKMKLLAKPFSEVVKDCAHTFAEYYAPLNERFPGKALLLQDYPGEWFDLLYFGDPDEHGEYPVLHFHYRDEPSVSVDMPGSDVWLASAVDIDTPSYERDNAATAKRLFGAPTWEAREHLA